MVGSHFVQLVSLCQVHFFEPVGFLLPLGQISGLAVPSRLLWILLGGPVNCIRIPNNSNSFLSPSTPAADAEEEDVAGGSVVSQRVVINRALSSNRSTKFEAELLPAPARRLKTIWLIALPGCSSRLLLPDMSSFCSRSVQQVASCSLLD